MLTAPAEAVSAVFVPAYKRAVLLSLILHGKTIELPKANAALIRRVRESCRPYDVRACLCCTASPQFTGPCHSLRRPQDHRR